MDILDDAILDNTKIVENFKNTIATKPPTQNGKPNKSHRQSEKSKSNGTKGTANGTASSRGKKAKRLPWNTDVLKDRFTPQPYPVQLLDMCTSFNNLNGYNNQRKNILLFMKSDEWKNYLKIMVLKQHALNLKTVELENKDQTARLMLMLMVTNMSSDVNPCLELVSRHTTLKIAGIDHNLSGSQLINETPKSYLMKLKSEAQIIIISIDILLDWFKKSYLTVDELALIIFTEASGAFHNESYKNLFSNYLSPLPTSSASKPNIVSFSTLGLTTKTTHKHVEQQIDYLANVFEADHIETATDLIDSYNLFNGIEPKECIQICDSVNLIDKATCSNQFQLVLLDLIKKTYVFMEDMEDAMARNNKQQVTAEENFSYIHTLCVRVLNECVYLLGEVGIWCLAKSLLPIICQLDKLSMFIEGAKKKQTVDESVETNGQITELIDADMKQELILQYTSTSLRTLRETCIGQFLQSKNVSKKIESKQNLTQIDLFLNNFCTPKVKSLVELLRTYKKTSDEFCCLIFVQNKQVATSLSLLLKKLAKEDLLLNFLYPNYVIGHAAVSSQQPNGLNTSQENNIADDTSGTDTASDSFKQEEILRKFYSGDINLLICTYEMEPHITAPTCVNLLIKFNCSSLNTDNESSLDQQHSSLPFDYFTYISTKSRAQSGNTSCYYFIERNNFDVFFHQFVRWKQIERTFIQKYTKLLNNASNQIRLVDTVDASKSLTLDNSIRFLNKYCIRLPSDALTQLTPRNIIITRQGGQEGAELEFKCIIYLPINSGIHESIESDWELSVTLAKKAASYKACLILTKKRELNDLLEPITKEMFYRLNHKSDVDDEREWTQFSSYFQKHQQQLNQNGQAASQSLQQQISNYMSHRPGGNKRKQVYTKRMSPFLYEHAITTQQPVYLYVFQCNLTTPFPNTDQPKVTTSLQTTCFGMITSKILLETSDFPIFTTNGEETVSCKLVKTGIYLTPNQLKLIKSFHRFLFSNILRLEGLGACPQAFLLNQTSDRKPGLGSYVTVLTELPGSNNMYDFNWQIMKSVENCSDRTFLRVPEYTRFVPENIDGAEDATDKPEQPVFKFDPEKFKDSVVVPFYRNNDSAAQFYCVSSINTDMSPLSSFPVSSVKVNAVNYETFYQYFAVKYSILIQDLMQPMLVVSHPSTRLNLLTPRYMNMKASVIQRSFHQPNQRCSINNNATERKASTKIYLVPELVNIHPFPASVLRRSMCIPSILYRINSLLVVEELRREIARSTGVGMPWYSEAQKFDKLSFDWDKNKELEVSEVPDQEVDVNSLKIQKKIEYEEAQAETTDSKWNFEISTWDENCLNEVNNGTSKNEKKDLFKNFDGMNKIFELNFEPRNIRNLIEQGWEKGENQTNENGWHDDAAATDGGAKTLFIDPNDMEFFDDFSDTSDEEFGYKLPVTQVSNKISEVISPDKKENKSFSSNSSADECRKDEFDRPDPDVKFQFRIDFKKLKADMKKKSAKLLSKLSMQSNDGLVKSLVTSETTALTGHEAEQQATDVKMGLDLENALDLKNFCSTNQLMDGGLVGQRPKYSVFINNGSGETNGDVVNGDLTAEANELNAWFNSVQIKVDFGDDKECVEETRIVENIRKKLLVPSKTCVETSKSDLEHVESHLDSAKYPNISLPLAEEKIDTLLGKLGANWTTNSLASDPNIPVEVSTGSTSTTFRNTEWSFDFKLDDIDKDNSIGPGPELLLQALTLANAADGFDLERLETVGDSFLKQAVTVYLFFAYPDVHEGKLSYLRSKQVSNYNLYKLGKRKCLQELIVSTKFEPLDSWLPPFYDSLISLNKTKQKPNKPASLMLSSLLSSEVANTDSSASINQFDKYKEHMISDKSIADSVEAIIGAYLISSGPKAALQVMSWFGLKVLPKVKCEDGSEVLVNIPEVPRPVINDPLKLHQMLEGYASFEACIGYKFRQPLYLLQAFTHASYVYNTLTDCYQRLEFLGDAILDYVITRHLYEHKKRHSPGELTDLRSALVNNNIFAYLAVKYDYYKYFKYCSPTIFTIVDNFVSNQKKRNDEFDLEEDFLDFPIDEDDEEEFNLMNGDSGNHEELLSKNEEKPEDGHQSYLAPQSHELEEMEVPKCLGDIFESVAGAIFLDSDKSFDTVWRVYYGLMKPHIDKFTSTVPKSPIRELFEMEPETAKFEKPERTIDGKIRVTVSVFGRGKFKGVGRNYRIAKNAAAKLALKYLKNNKF